MSRHQKDPLRPLTRLSRSQSAPAAEVDLARALLAIADGAGYTVAARDRIFEMFNGVSARRVPAANARASEVALHDARQAVDARRYDDARRALARIPAGDPLRPDADVLVAQIQRMWPIVSPMLAPDAAVRGAGSP